MNKILEEFKINDIQIKITQQGKYAVANLFNTRTYETTNIRLYVQYYTDWDENNKLIEKYTKIPVEDKQGTFPYKLVIYIGKKLIPLERKIREEYRQQKKGENNYETQTHNRHLY